MNLDRFFEHVIDDINYFTQVADAYAKQVTVKSDAKPAVTYYNARLTPDVQRVQYNGNTTIVWFTDGTKVTVKLSENDTYDRKTAIVYAICKRLFSKVMPDGTVNSNGFGMKLQKLADSGFDQQTGDELKAKRKAEAEANRKKQEAAHQTAFDRKVKAKVEQMKIERAATEALREAKNKILAEDKPTAPRGYSKASTYVRPNKPFSKFTQEEKRAYWREANKKRNKK